jgi:hypothetical protein
MDHAHHTLGREVTGDDPAHIVGACETCNLKIGRPTVVVEPEAKPVTDWGA